MKKILAVMMFVLVASTGFAGGIDGTWKAKLSGPDGDMELTFVLKMVDGKLTGVVQTPNGDMSITNGQVDGNHFSFDVPFNDTNIKHDGTLKEDDTIAMKVTGTPMGDMEMTLSRQV